MRSILKWTGIAAVGAILAYLFDPVSGRGRRTRLRDQAASRARKGAEQVEQRARYEAGRAKGVMHAIRSEPREFVDAQTLVQKIRSEAIGPSPIPSADVEIDVEAGEVILRGASRDPAAIRDLVRRIERVTGVHGVRNEMVVGGTARDD